MDSEIVRMDTVRARILVIDDELGPRESLRMLFKDQYDVTTADSVDAGLDHMRRLQPDLVIMDIKMPHKTGIQGLQEIRAVDPLVSIVMLTGFGSLDTAQGAIRHGAVDYVLKPFDKDEMRAVAARQIHRNRVARKRSAALRELEAVNARYREEQTRIRHLAELGQVSSEFVHDLSNPLTVVGHCVQLLEMNLRGDSNGGAAESLEYLSHMQKSMDRCFQMMERWRDFGRKNPERMKPVRVADILREVADATRPIAESVHAEIFLAENGPDCVILADALELFRALQNIVSNAIQALPPEGGRIWLAWSNGGSRTEIKIRDNGGGIPPDKLEKVFDPYYSTKKQAGGMGLGLFITHKVIQSHDGTVKLENNPDGGVTARIELPVHAGDPADIRLVV